jgi:hypothetical protein
MSTAQKQQARSLTCPYLKLVDDEVRKALLCGSTHSRKVVQEVHRQAELARKVYGVRAIHVLIVGVVQPLQQVR